MDKLCNELSSKKVIWQYGSNTKLKRWTKSKLYHKETILDEDVNRNY